MHAPLRILASLTLGAALVSPIAFAQSASAPALGTPAATPPTLAATVPVSTAAAVSVAAAGDPNQSNWWAEADADGDGQLSVAEATANPSIGTRFTAIDTNSDGFVTQDEYRVYFTVNTGQVAGKSAQHRAVLTRDLWLMLDTDADRRISRTEAAADAALLGEFTVIDADADGFVVQAEYTLYAQARR